MSGSPGQWNLLPRDLVRERARRRRRALWARAGGAYVAVLATVCAAAWTHTRPGPDSARAHAITLAERNAVTRAAIDHVRRQLASVSDILDPRQGLAEQPDFSVVLKLVSASVEPDTIIRQVSLRGGGTDTLRSVAAPAGSEREPKHFVLTIAGTSRGEIGVSQMSARLKESGAFDHVEIRRTGRENTPAAEGVTFEVECVMSDAVARGALPAPATLRPKGDTQ